VKASERISDGDPDEKARSRGLLGLSTRATKLPGRHERIGGIETLAVLGSGRATDWDVIRRIVGTARMREHLGYTPAKLMKRLKLD
jgi:hypothetical protein